MAWTDILGGLMGGASQGLGQIQDDRRKNAQLVLQQEAAKRQAVQEANAQLMQSYNTTPGGAEIDPEMASKYKALGLGGLTRSPTGGIIKMKSPQEQQIDLVLQTREMELKDKQEKDAFLDELHNAGSGFFDQPLMNRLSRSRALEIPDDMVMSPQEKLKFSPQLAAATIQAGPQYARAQAQSQGSPLDLQKLNIQREAAAVREAEALSKTPLGTVDPQKYKAQLDLARARMGMAGASQAQPSQGPAPGTTRVINGVNAVWDGQGWKRQ